MNNLDKAAAAVAALSGVCVEAGSSVYRTEPQENKDQEWFANQVIRCSCQGYSAEELMTALLSCEAELGRVRDVSTPAARFGPRVIDIDLLLYGATQSDSELITLPHPRMWQRAFVLVPLLDVFVEPQEQGDGVIIRADVLDSLERLEFRVEGDCIWQ